VAAWGDVVPRANLEHIGMGVQPNRQTTHPERTPGLPGARKSLSSKFLIPVACFTLLLAGWLIYDAYVSQRQHTDQLLSAQADLALNFDLAMRKYVKEVIRPAAAERLGEESFVPELMSTSYVARRVFCSVQEEFPEYLLKFSSLRPRNPINQAGPDEARIIDYFAEHPDANRWSGRLEIDGALYWATFAPRRAHADCLACHGDPADAPDTMLARYGATRGFGWQEGDVIGLDTIGIPLRAEEAHLQSAVVLKSVTCVLATALLFWAIARVFRRRVRTPLREMADHFERCALNDPEHLTAPIAAHHDDEIGAMAQGFNVMAARLKTAYHELEERIQDRATALSQAQSELHQSEQRYRSMVQDQRDVLYQADADGNITFVNQACARVLCVTADEFEGRTILDFVPPEEHQTIREALSGLTPSRPDVSLEHQLIVSEEERHWFHWNISGRFDPDGRLTDVQAVGRDVTDRKQAEHALHQKERFLSSVLDAIEDGLLVLDRDLEVLRTNRATAEIFGTSPVVIGEKCHMVLHGSDEACEDCPCLPAIETGSCQRLVRALPDDQGDETWLEISAYPLRDGADEVIGVIELVRDVTERLRQDEEHRELLHKRAELEQIINRSRSVAFLWEASPGWPVLYVSNNIAEFGYTPEELYSGERPFASLIHPDDIEMVAAEVREYAESGRDDFHQEYRIRAADGTYRWVEDHTWVRRDEDGKATHYQGILYDVTTRRESEERLAQSARLEHAINRLLNEAITTSDPEEACALCLDIAAELTQSSFGWIAELNDRQRLDTLAVSDRGSGTSLLPSAGLPEEWRNLKLDSFWGEALQTDAPVLINDPKWEPEQADLPGAHPPIESFLAVPYGTRSQSLGMIAVANRTEPYTPEDVDALRQLGAVFVEVLARKRTEWQLRETNAQLMATLAKQRQTAAELEAAMGQLEAAVETARSADQAKSEFLANMSHEIRTPMTAILGFTEAIIDGCPRSCDFGEHELPRIMATVQRNGKYLLQILNDILDLSKIEAGRIEIEQIACAPIDLMAEVYSLLQVRAATKGLAFEFEFEGPLPSTIRTDPTRLRQVLINLVGNAIKFTEQGKVIVRVCFEAPNPRVRSRRHRAILQFSVIDSGIGMTEDQVTRLFQPFQQADNSTTRRFGGTGLGLTISQRLLERMGGTISVESKPGVGSTFLVNVPTGAIQEGEFHQDPAALWRKKTEQRKSTANKADLPTLEGVNVLLVEDAPDTQQLILFILERAKAKVAVADNGKEALDLVLPTLAEAGGKGKLPFDVILMDMQMPVLDGYEATAQLRAAQYAGPIIALTAHAMSSDRDRCLEVGCDEYATKPVDRVKLLKMIKRFAAEVSPAKV
jgi:PAS domain S-box-containing protein